MIARRCRRWPQGSQRPDAVEINDKETNCLRTSSRRPSMFENAQGAETVEVGRFWDWRVLGNGFVKTQIAD